ncbi:MAG: aminotransferase class I/II-fold pyridoxal phosphate-dependent enzyme [Cyanobacteria bacterium P01_H01_bin.74]
MFINQALIDYQKKKRARFHVPGHAGNGTLFKKRLALGSETAFQFDLTEVDDLDVLSEPTGCIAESQAWAAEIFGVQRSYYLINGASVGLMAAMLTALKAGDKVLVSRNCHRSVINGLVLTGAQPVWVLPNADYYSQWGFWGALSIDALETAKKRQPDCKALILPSPTYEGIGSDIAAIATWCQKNNLLLIVDEAHGSLWPFFENLPVSAAHFACDVVVQSLHKSATSLTQTAIAHLPHGSRIDPAAFQQALNVLQTTSPSYLLLASLESTVGFLASAKGKATISNCFQWVKQFRQKAKAQLNAFSVFSPQTEEARNYWDPAKLVIKHHNQHHITPPDQWAIPLETQPNGIAYESINHRSALYMGNIGLTAADFDRLLEALHAYEGSDFSLLKEISKPAESPDIEKIDIEKIDVEKTEANFSDRSFLPQMALSPRAAFFSQGSPLMPEAAVGKIAKEVIASCPPGIPVLLPGEIITERHLPYLSNRPIMTVT